jgi:hypothetical protein
MFCHDRLDIIFWVLVLVGFHIRMRTVFEFVFVLAGT